MLTVTLLVTMAFANKQDSEAAARVEHADQLSDIRAEGAPPFRLKLSVKIIDKDGTVLDGSYTEVWVSKTQWRRETVLGDFRRIQVASGRKLWLLDSSTVVPEQLSQFSIFHLDKVQPEKWKSTKDREIKGVGVRCVKNSRGIPLELCFDKMSGTLASNLLDVYLGARIVKRTCLYSDYQKAGDRVFATSYRCDEDKHPSLEGRIVELAAEPAPDRALFAPLDGATESMNCIGAVKAPRQVYSPEPVPPRTGSTIVAMRIVVGIDGTPHNLKITSAPNSDYDKATLSAVRQWRFKPATCDGEPMEHEVAVEIAFHIP